MIVIAILLIAAAAVLTTGVVIESTESTTLQIFGLSVEATGAGIFLAGAGAMLAFLAGLWLLRFSLARARRRRAQTKHLQRTSQQEVASLQAERDQLSAELNRTRDAAAPEVSGEPGTASKPSQETGPPR